MDSYNTAYRYIQRHPHVHFVPLSHFMGWTPKSYAKAYREKLGLKVIR